MPDLRTTIQEAMSVHNCTIASAARVASMSPPQLSEYLAGKRDLRGETLGRLFDALGVRVVQPKPKRPASG